MKKPNAIIRNLLNGKRILAAFLTVIMITLSISAVLALTPVLWDERHDSIDELISWLADKDSHRYNIDGFIKKAGEKGILVPYIDGESVAYQYNFEGHCNKSNYAKIYAYLEIDGNKYVATASLINEKYKLYAERGYIEYKKAVTGKEYKNYGVFEPIIIYNGETEYNAAFQDATADDVMSIYLIVDDWEVRFRIEEPVIAFNDTVQALSKITFKTQSIYSDGHFDAPQDPSEPYEIAHEQGHFNDGFLVLSCISYIHIAVLMAVILALAVLLAKRKKSSADGQGGKSGTLIVCVIIAGALLFSSVFAVAFINLRGVDYSLSAKDIYSIDENGKQNYNFSDIVETDKLIYPTREQAKGIKPDMTLDETIKTVGRPQKVYASYDDVIFEFILRDGNKVWAWTELDPAGPADQPARITRIVFSQSPEQAFDWY